LTLGTGEAPVNERYGDFSTAAVAELWQSGFMSRWFARLKSVCILSAFLLSSASRFLWAQFPAPTVEFAPATHGVVKVPLFDVLYLKAGINGHSSIDLLFDTGSGSIMSTNLAQRLGLKLEGQSSVSGVGAKTIPGRFTRVDSLTIGGLTLHGIYFVVIDSPTPDDEDFAIIGDQFVQHMVITLNFERRQITFTEQDRFHYIGKSKPVALQAQGNDLTVVAMADGRPGTFIVDTGSEWSLILLSSFVTKHDLIRYYGPKFQGFGGRGFGGSDHAFYARVHTLRMGDTEVHDPITFLLTDTAGGSNNSASLVNYDGTIGQHILRQFTSTFDLQHGAVYLDKNASYGKPDIFNRAGLMLDEGADMLTVMTVLPGSTGAAAGIVEGDEILAINGQSAKQGTAMSDEAFTRRVGSVLRLKIRRGARERIVTVKLREVL
jgi:hypothetical protein